jgi:nitrogen fixation NifU-like protein
MAEAGYSEELREHLDHPRNAGPMPDADAVGVQGNPICGDTMKLMLRIRDNRVTEARWQTVGCEPTLAASSIATEMAVGRSLDEVDGITAEDINAALGGIPASKLHAAALAAGALHRAVAGYRARPGA